DHAGAAGARPDLRHVLNDDVHSTTMPCKRKAVIRPAVVVGWAKAPKSVCHVARLRRAFAHASCIALATTFDAWATALHRLRRKSRNLGRAVAHPTNAAAGLRSLHGVGGVEAVEERGAVEELLVQLHVLGDAAQFVEMA